MTIAAQPLPKAAPRLTCDGNEAAALVAHRLSEVIAIYPITPSTNMGEFADEWSAKGKTNLWGQVPTVVEMQSEGGAAGALHGAVLAGSLVTTFTASQGLLLMIPNMYKLAGELQPAVMHVTARAIATHGLSIFGDHSDIMGVRPTGWSILIGTSVQEAHDLAAVAHATALESRVPVLHAFDGFRTSHEIATMVPISDDQLRQVVSDEAIAAHRARSMDPDRPILRGTAQNPDVFFQSREACNPFYTKVPEAFQKVLDRFATVTGRRYGVVEYRGAPDAERVVVSMGSGAAVVNATAEALAAAGEKVGSLVIRLFQPFPAEALLAALPASVKRVAILDRTKEPGTAGEPLFLSVVSALAEAGRAIICTGGRYGLGSKEFTPADAKAVFTELSTARPRPRFTVGITDDVGGLSLPVDASWTIEDPKARRCVFFGLGADGTVGANKNSIKIIGEGAGLHAQGYFVYDSKKSGSMTVSHLRFGPNPINSPYLIRSADFVAVHQPAFLDRVDCLALAAPGATVLVNTPDPAESYFSTLPTDAQRHIIDRKLRLFIIDATKVAHAAGLGLRINSVMQTCFFALAEVLPREDAIERIKKAVIKTYSKRGEAVVQANLAAIDSSVAGLHEVAVPAAPTNARALTPAIGGGAPAYVRDVLGAMAGFKGDDLPVSAMPVDGAFPTGTSKWEKRGINVDVPTWNHDVCIQCGKCAFVCPHGCIRAKAYDGALLSGAPEGFKSLKSSFKEVPGLFTIQVSPDDCTGCRLCVETCPAKDKKQVGRKALAMVPAAPVREAERRNWEFFETLPDVSRTVVPPTTVKSSQLQTPLFEFSGACGGCGETPYLKLLSQLCGDRLMIANATGCSSIYGGNLPTTPWTTDRKGRGPAWANSLFEDNAEFGLGMRLSVDQTHTEAMSLVKALAEKLPADLAADVLGGAQKDDAGIEAQRARVERLRAHLPGIADPRARRLESIAHMLVRRSVWIIGGDGWAYDIGYGGVDHVLASGRNVKLLVLDTEVYSNTGGQASKSTPTGAVAKFAANGKDGFKKDLGLMAMAYGNVYVARIAMGASDAQTLKALAEAEAYDGPALVIAYSHCIAHGIAMHKGLEQQKLAVASGHWPLYRFNPDLAKEGKSPLCIDSKDPTATLDQYRAGETRFTMLKQADPGRADALAVIARKEAVTRWALYGQLAAAHTPAAPSTPDTAANA